ncbi:epoxyqueuosine reductase QueH [Campylobacter corcagiensis]|uniref:Epoxyqueuosine reductase QueH n=1 Tax=Campylobacter corcagiensis TaxID=1448857 RepID=A0A7M1LJR1_9BACT|nr:epoxyqueuosine reductase QueH [Campylobacter corcagiensis]QOQ87765.1 epoxyqueuosine reductase QueH [Campylobacter corcagiensis]
MVVQICCSVDFAYFLKRLRDEYPNEKIVGYFYNPNIHPYAEYMLRYYDTVRIAKKYGIEVELGSYDLERWMDCVKGQEMEPERGERCQSCFDFRMEETAKFAVKNSENLITTTLLMSPKKTHAQLEKSLSEICDKYWLNFIAPDYRKGGGTQAQMKLAKDEKLYHQKFCGCIYGLKAMNKFSLEADLFSPINRQILPNSIEQRAKFYAQDFKDKSIKKDKFINYRLLKGVVKFNQKAVKSYFLFNSHFDRNFIKFSIDKECDEFYADKECVLLLSFAKFCEISKVKFKSFDEFLATTLSVSDELEIRAKIFGYYSFSPIIIVEKLQKAEVKIEAISKIYSDIREILV